MTKRYQRSGVELHRHLHKQVSATARAVAEMLESRRLLNGTPEVSVELAGAVGGAIWESEVVGTTAYTGTGNQFRVLDVSTPSNPVCIGQVLLPGVVSSLAVSGSYAYVADGTAGLQIVDISNPASPALVGGYDTPAESLGVAVSGSYAYLANTMYGLRVIDVSNPAAPTQVGRINRADAYDVAISGTYAYVPSGTSGLVIYNISNPAAPSFVSGAYTNGGDARGVSISGSYAYVAADRAGLLVIDISDPHAPFMFPGYFTAARAKDVAVSGSYAFVASEGAGLRIANVSDPWHVTLAGSCDTSGFARGVTISGSYAYVADYNSGLKLIDISSAAAPTLVGSYIAPGEAWNVSVAGSYAYVAAGESGLEIIDISDPSAPIPTGSYDTLTYDAMASAYGVSVAGSYAYVAAATGGLQILDISNPAAPTMAGSYDGGWAEDVTLSGSYAYVADGGGLLIFDISNPSAPVLVGSDTTLELTSAVSVSGSYVYVPDYGPGLRILDISNPATPTLVGSYATPGHISCVSISGSYAYVTDDDSGLQIIDISNPAAPTLVGSYAMPKYTAGVTVSGMYAYVVNPHTGLQIINISNPAAPTLAGSYATAGYPYFVKVSGSYVYVADTISGLQILRLNTAPTDISVSSTSVAENQPAGTVVGALSTSDAIAGDTYSYTLVSGDGSADNALFQIVGDQLMTSAQFDYEAGNSYSIRVRSTDQGGLYTEKVFTITVTDVDEVAPTVTAVYVRGSNWSGDYLSFLAGNLAGSSATYGYAIPVGTGAAELQTLPWRNLNRISIAFSEDVSVAQAQFAIAGSVGSYSISGFAYSSADHVATWSLSAAIGPDKLYVAVPGSGSSAVRDAAGNVLDGEWVNPSSYSDSGSTSVFPSGNGTAGGDFAFRFDVLPGDSTGGSLGKVNVADMLQTKSRTSLPVTVDTYRSDFDGNNLVNVADVLYVKIKSNVYSLPVNPPVLPLLPVVGSVFSQVSLLQGKRLSNLW